ncbi:MAG: hypothetical protein HY352_05885 [Candidatus Omnitrophica bacterium]|nr:hypothetical protein [Candidatus Omnitrophota bacterium]
MRYRWGQVSASCAVIGLILLSGQLRIAAEEYGTARPPTQPSGVDLVPAGIVPSAVEPPKVFVFMQNRGDRVVRNSFDVELWLDDRLLGRQRVDESVPANAEHSVKLLFMRPMTMANGLHSMTLKVDTGNDVHETNEANNVELNSIWFDDSGTQAPLTAQGRR